jgi:hypothetical protein
MKTYSFSDVDARFEGGGSNLTDLDNAVIFAGYVVDPTLANWTGNPPSDDLLNLARQFLGLVARLVSAPP